MMIGHSERFIGAVGVFLRGSPVPTLLASSLEFARCFPTIQSHLAEGVQKLEYCKSFSVLLLQYELNDMTNSESVPTNAIRVILPENEKLKQFVERLLRSRRKAEALHWLASSRLGRRRRIGRFRGAKHSLEFVKAIYAVGAAKVIVADIKTNAAGNQRSEKIIVVLPTEMNHRENVFAWCKAQGSAIGSLPERDNGESHIYIYAG